MAPPRIRKVFSGFAPDLQIDLKGPCRIHLWVNQTFALDSSGTQIIVRVFAVPGTTIISP